MTKVVFCRVKSAEDALGSENKVGIEPKELNDGSKLEEIFSEEDEDDEENEENEEEEALRNKALGKERRDMVDVAVSIVESTGTRCDILKAWFSASSSSDDKTIQKDAFLSSPLPDLLGGCEAPG